MAWRGREWGVEGMGSKEFCRVGCGLKRCWEPAGEQEVESCDANSPIDGHLDKAVSVRGA